MRGFVSWLLAGTLAVVAMYLIAPAVGLGLSAGAWPTVAHGSPMQAVNRIHKTDRLSVPIAVGKPQVPREVPTVLVGCDPAFSPLSAAARGASSAQTISGRCLA